MLSVAKVSTIAARESSAEEVTTIFGFRPTTAAPRRRSEVASIGGNACGRAVTGGLCTGGIPSRVWG
jgi:hypothetical protein